MDGDEKGDKASLIRDGVHAQSAAPKSISRLRKDNSEKGKIVRLGSSRKTNAVSRVMARLTHQDSLAGMIRSASQSHLFGKKPVRRKRTNKKTSAVSPVNTSVAAPTSKRSTGFGQAVSPSERSSMVATSMYTAAAIDRAGNAAIGGTCSSPISSESRKVNDEPAIGIVERKKRGSKIAESMGFVSQLPQNPYLRRRTSSFKNTNNSNSDAAPRLRDRTETTKLFEEEDSDVKRTTLNVKRAAMSKRRGSAPATSGTAEDAETIADMKPDEIDEILEFQSRELNSLSDMFKVVFHMSTWSYYLAFASVILVVIDNELWHARAYIYDSADEWYTAEAFSNGLFFSRMPDSCMHCSHVDGVALLLCLVAHHKAKP